MEPNAPVVPTVPVTSVPVFQALPGPINLLKSSWGLFTTNWRILVPIFVLPTALIYIGQLLGETDNGLSTILSVILILGGCILSIVSQPASINAIHRYSTETNPVLSLEGQYKVGASFFWSILLITIISVLVSFGSFALLFIPGIIISVYVFTGVFSCVIDGKKGFSALTESYSLVSGRWLPVFGRLLFIGLIYVIISMIIGAIGGASGGKITAFSALISLILTAFLGPVAGIYSYKLYSALKATRQGPVETETFKKWLVAFVVIGIIAPIVMFVGFFALLMTTSRVLTHDGLEIPTSARVDMQNSSTNPIESQ
ncbi:MAG: hypothetical protein WCT02_03600 [Candidatus Paceibacterota bacterium]|jgi:hypothetical protein